MKNNYMSTIPSDLEVARTELVLLRAEVKRLQEENQQLKQALNNAKDASPVMRCSLKRTLKLVHQCCMELVRWGSRWLLKMGNKCRVFPSLKKVWELLNQESWSLSDIFPSDLKPPKPPKPKRIPLPHRTDRCGYHFIDEATARWWRYLVPPEFKQGDASG